MTRINVTFYDEIFEKLQTRTKNKKCGSIAQSIRELIDLGFRVEDAANQENTTESEPNDLNFITDILKNNMRLTVESLLINRQLIQEILEKNNDESTEILRKCKEQALMHVKKMFSESGETIS